jgi:hypothetical protein
MTMTNEGLAFGDQVFIRSRSRKTSTALWREVYQPPAHSHVVVSLRPAVSDAIVHAPSTVSMPIGMVKKVAPAA